MADFSKREHQVRQGLHKANGDVMIGRHTMRTRQNPCDPAAMRAALAEYEALAREMRDVAQAAAAAAEFATVNAEEAADGDAYMQAMLRGWRAILVDCEGQAQGTVGSATPSPPSPPPPLPDPLEAMLIETAARARYLQLRRMAEPGAARITTRPVEDILDEIGDAGVARDADGCRTALRAVPPPFAAAVLAAEARADDEPEEWYPRPTFDTTRAAAEACAAVAQSVRLQNLREELQDATMADLYEREFGARPAGFRPRAEIEAELNDAEIEARWYSGASIGLFVGETGTPAAGIGFRRDGALGEAPDEFATTSDETVRTFGVGAALDILVGGTSVRLGASYSEGEAEGAFDIPGNQGVDSGVPYGALSESGSSGIGTPFGLSGTMGVDTSLFIFDFSIPLTTSQIFSLPTTPAEAEWRDPMDDARAVLDIFGAFMARSATYRGSAAYSGGGEFVFEFSQDRLQELDESYYALGLRGRLAVPFGGDVTGHLTGSAGGYHRNAELDSTERNLCNFCPAADQDFTIAIEDTDDGFGFLGEAGAAIEFNLAPGVSLLAGGSARYLSEVGAVFNPNSGDQVFFDGLTTAIATGDSWFWRFGLGVRIAI
ncbi:hypothetical protein [Sphingomonas gilva]|nr:hypothetical protein [Sphingomonas gilva]